MYAIDLHTHSQASPDGSLSVANYKHMLSDGQLDYIAITDHNTLEFALQLHKLLGDRIIVGEEITAQEGEIIGLYLRERVLPNLPADITIKQIRKQGGLVYIPHPFESIRKGLPKAVLDSVADSVDIIETHNGRALLQDRSKIAMKWSRVHKRAGAASSDAHGWHGWGRTYSIVEGIPDKKTLPISLTQAQVVSSRPGLRSILYPRINYLRKKLGRA